MPKVRHLKLKAVGGREGRESSVQTTLSSYFSATSAKLATNGNVPTSSRKRTLSPITRPSEKRTKSCDEPNTSSKLSEKTRLKLNNFSLGAPSSPASTSDPRPSLVPTDSSNTKQTPARASQTKHRDSSDSEDSDCAVKFTAVRKFSRSEAKQSGASTSNQSQNSSINNSSVKNSPLEQQYLEIKEQYPDALLFVECGYKYRFFGEDAERAAEELGIYCHMDHNLMTASVPTHRLHVHLRRLVAKGYKVGVVKQTETAALKAAGENRSAPFTRQLSALYTASTLIGEDVDGGVDDACDLDEGRVFPSDCLVCVADQQHSSSDVTVAFVAVVPSTGDVVYDVLEDTAERSRLDSCLSQLQPVELLLSAALSTRSRSLLTAVSAASSIRDDRVRLEELPQKHFNASNSDLTQFFTQHSSSDEVLQKVVNLPELVVSCLHAVIYYLRDFKLDTILAKTCSLSRFTSQSHHLELSGCTLRNLSVLRGEGGAQGSLLWLLNHTRTSFGSRRLRQWLAKPLSDATAIEARLDAVSDLMNEQTSVVKRMRRVLDKLPDLERNLGVVLHKKSSPLSLFTTCAALEHVAEEFETALQQLTVNETLHSSLLKYFLKDVTSCLNGVGKWTQSLNEQAAKDGDKPNLFRDSSSYPDLVEDKRKIADLQDALREHLREIRGVLCAPKLEFVTVLNTEFLVEVKNSDLSRVPPDWLRVNMTKSVSRFHTPFTLATIQSLNQSKERLSLHAHAAWLHFLGTFESDYRSYRKAVDHIADLDCLCSLATVAKHYDFTRPSIVTSGPRLVIEGGRHPLIELVTQQQYVPNNTHLEGDGERCQVLTGPNMGGKSSYMRQVALIALLAHVGSYVPAQRAEVSVLDAIHTRMGAYDSLSPHRQSTFLVELSEMSHILRTVTRSSLVIVDELGRGSSSLDGATIAYATLQHLLLQTRCLCLFVTHYPLVTRLAPLYQPHVGNYHMTYILHRDEPITEEDDTSVPSLTFLYQCERGVAHTSYGLNVARLAGLPPGVLTVARRKTCAVQTAETTTRKNKEEFLRVWKKELGEEL